MKSFIPLCLSVMAAVSFAREIEYPLEATRISKRHNRVLGKREVPQEHCHEKYLRACNELLKLDNPDEIQDTVFGLLGNAAALTGAGKITDPDCLHQATADRCLTNAKNIGSVQGIVDALVFQTLERNTGSVGLKSVICTSIKPVNPEIALLQVHQDPASEGAAELNKAITLELARQIAIAGGDPLIAIESGTFAPGEIGDPTGAGNTCDDLDDPIGCIFTKNLLVPDATEEEVLAAVADIVPGGGNAGDDQAAIDEKAAADKAAADKAAADKKAADDARGAADKANKGNKGNNGNKKVINLGGGRQNNQNNNQNVRIIKVVKIIH